VIDLRLGRWEDVLADVGEVDAVITDPPYSERTHSGHDDGGRDGAHRRPIAYERWDACDMRALVKHWAARAAGWIVVLSDSEQCSLYRRSLEGAGLCGFQPVPCVMPGMTVRLAGDGPSSWSIYANVGRPRTKAMATWGTLPGAYIVPPERAMTVAGGKPLWLMRAIIRDYTRPGDLVCDPCAGGGTTLLAAAIEGRRAIGAEMDPDTHAKATARLAAGYTPNMLERLPEVTGEQGGLGL